MNLVKYSSEFLAHIRKARTDKPTNVQNNCIKLFFFGVDITSLFLHPEITRTFRAEKSSSTQKFVCRVLRPASHTSSITHRFISG